ncbi:MAG: hypothetical protein ACFCU7_06365 [Pleurocapsa sp.]
MKLRGRLIYNEDEVNKARAAREERRIRNKDRNSAIALVIVIAGYTLFNVAASFHANKSTSQDTVIEQISE